MLSENAKLVFNFIKAHDGEDFTANDIAVATDLKPRSVNGILTASFQRHRDADKNIIPLIVRVPGEIEDPATGLHKGVNFIQLTEDGRLFNPDAE